MIELTSCIEFINQGKFQRVALQFPDDLLKEATKVVDTLAEQVPTTKLFILGDTTFGSCCVDYVAAQHVKADALLHFGDACLSSRSSIHDDKKNNSQKIPLHRVVPRIPVHYCLPKSTLLQLNHFNLALKHEIACIAAAREEDESKKMQYIILFHELSYTHQRTELAALAKANSTEEVTVILASLRVISTQEEEVVDDGHRVAVQIGGFDVILPEQVQVSQCHIHYIGHETGYFTQIALRLNQCQSLKIYTPLEDDGQEEATASTFKTPTILTHKILARRYFLVEKAKTSNIIGILVGTLGVTQYLHIIAYLKDLIHSYGKTCQLFVVGKINEPKISNFSEIDIFVVVACSFTSLIETRGFYHDIITPFELDMALNQQRQWTGEYTLSFQDILENGPCYLPYHSAANSTENDNAKDDDDDDVDDEPEYNMVTGKLVPKMMISATKQSSHEDGKDFSSSHAMVPSLSGRGDLIATDSNTVFSKFQQRTFHGLDMGLNETSTTIEQGFDGIARQYQSEQT